jgi:hypothetical protein
MDLSKYKTKEELRKAIDDRQAQLSRERFGEMTQREMKQYKQLEKNLYRLRKKLEEMGK